MKTIDRPIYKDFFDAVNDSPRGVPDVKTPISLFKKACHSWLQTLSEEEVLELRDQLIAQYGDDGQPDPYVGMLPNSRDTEFPWGVLKRRLMFFYEKKRFLEQHKDWHIFDEDRFIAWKCVDTKESSYKPFYWTVVIGGFTHGGWEKNYIAGVAAALAVCEREK
jgi:hypothetical protein